MLGMFVFCLAHHDLCLSCWQSAEWSLFHVSQQGLDPFLESLYSTLEAWGIGTRASRLVPFADFAAELNRWSPTFADLDGLLIDDPGLGDVSVGAFGHHEMKRKFTAR